MTLAVPEGKHSLVFTSQFITSEFLGADPKFRENDNATLEFVGLSGDNQTILLGEAAASTG